MAWALVLLPLLAGPLLWAIGARGGAAVRPAVLGAVAVAVLVGDLVLAALAAAGAATGTYEVGAGLVLVADLSSPANVVAVLVPAIAACVVAWAAAHEARSGMARLLGLLVTFAGAMQLLVVAGDLLTLVVGFELVGGLSWALVGHDWRNPAAPRAAAHAFNATRAGGLGLFLAAGASWSASGSMAFEGLDAVTGVPLHVTVAGILLAAVAKSAQGPFAPWLFSAMAGPTSVSALLHSSTMVAAGAYVLVRLFPVLDRVGWFAPTTIAIGLLTALAGGVVALLQSHAKKLLAASTSAQYGLMLVAIGAGYPAVAIAHLVVHAVFKAQLFLSAGVAMHAVGSPELGRMRLGGQLRTTTVLTAAGSLALAAVPPLGGAWSKETVVAAAGHVAPWLAVAVIGSGALSAAYATRFHLLAYGPVRADDPGPRQLAHTPSAVEQGAIGVLGVASVLLGALWLPPVREVAGRLLDGALATGPVWELVASLLVVVVTVYVVWTLDARGRLGHVGTEGATAAWGDWLRLPDAIRAGLVDPTLGLGRALARFDDRVVDAAVESVAAAARSGAAGVARRVDPLLDGLPHGVAAGGRQVASAATRWVEPALDGLPRGTAGTGRGLARASTRVAERGVDGAVAAVAWFVDRAGADARRTHTGMVHHQFVVIVVGLGLVAVAAVVGR